MSRKIKLTRKKPEKVIVTLTMAEFEAQKCVHCGGVHLRACPRVKRMVFAQSMQLAEIEFWKNGEWDESVVLWPESERIINQGEEQ
jgi:hypothetical protein